MNTNEILVDRTISHAVTLERLKAGETHEVMRQLSRLERDLVRDLTRANLTSWRKDRYEKLLKQTRNTIKQHYRTIRDTQQQEMTEVADLESQWTVRALNGAISEPIGVYVPIASVAWTESQLAAIASNVLIEGAKSASWWAGQALDLQRRFADTVKQGLLRGQGTPEIVRAIRGTAINQYTDGVMQLSRAQAEALVRTSIGAVSSDARTKTYKENSDLISSQTWLSTLDGRTTIEFCIPRSMKRYTLDGEPIGHTLPWKGGPGKIHWQCRSAAVANVKAWHEIAGKTVPGTDGETIDRIFHQKLREKGWSEDRIAAARRRTQSSMDGQVSADIDYETWLRGKSAAFQAEVLGKGKAELFRSGLLTSPAALLDFRGNPLTLKQLRKQLGVIE